MELFKERSIWYSFSISCESIMDKNEDIKNEKEEKYIANLVKLGKLISIEASKNPKLEEKIKKMSSY